jgi:hypothetical protein
MDTAGVVFGKYNSTWKGLSCRPSLVAIDLRGIQKVSRTPKVWYLVVSYYLGLTPRSKHTLNQQMGNF